MLSSDGALRWTGAPVGKLIAGEDVLRPRLRVIADEQLTGASREAVQNRLDLWLKTHIERLLGPLFGLAAADDVTGIARGVAFQLIEALGVLERQKVAEEVKGLDQPSRATLRKYGVRFGAYHLYLPALLKPAPRSLAAQLWMLKHEGPEAKGLDELQRLAGSGRTSIPVDKETPKPLYRTIGYRVCGERAIRVDILERLADLIRPALAWREGVNPRPAGAFNGFGFTVTGAMTSLTGASGEDFASILRSLGYRMEKRPKPKEPEPAPAATETAEVPAATAAEQEAEIDGADACHDRACHDRDSRHRACHDRDRGHSRARSDACAGERAGRRRGDRARAAGKADRRGAGRRARRGRARAGVGRAHSGRAVRGCGCTAGRAGIDRGVAARPSARRTPAARWRAPRSPASGSGRRKARGSGRHGSAGRRGDRGSSGDGRCGRALNRTRWRASGAARPSAPPPA